MNADLSEPWAVTALVSEFDLVLSAVPGFLGYQTLKKSRLQTAGTPTSSVDGSFDGQRECISVAFLWLPRASEISKSIQIGMRQCKTR